jgi:hypothetical protein
MTNEAMIHQFSFKKGSGSGLAEAVYKSPKRIWQHPE